MNSPGPGFFVAAALPVLLVAFIYIRGVLRRDGSGRAIAPIRHIAFAAGLALLLMSMEWPFAGWAHHLFYVHQIGFMIARIVAPMLLLSARPAALLIAGLPDWARHDVLRPGLSAPVSRRVWHYVADPFAALGLYVVVLYFWEVPQIQDAALAIASLGYVMHLSLLLTGLLFWSRVFERRPAPHGASHGTRLMMIWIAILTQIALGAYLTVKTTILYPAYGTIMRLGMMSPVVDEGRGGFFLWIPSGLISLVALIVVIDMWGRHETRMDEKRKRWSPSNSAILLYPETAAALREMTRGKNRKLAVGMAGFVLLVFTAVTGIAVSAHRLNRRENIRQYILSR
jgi:putative membrane protein